MRRTWTLVLILALAGAIVSWFFLPPGTAMAVTVVAAVAALISITFRR
jgi:uncharacterized membrane protein